MAIAPTFWRVLPCTCAFALCAATAAAQTPRPPLAPSRENSQRIRWLEYKMVAGRLAATSNYPAGMNISFGTPAAAGSIHERLQIITLKDQASLNYALVRGGESLSFVVAQDGEVRASHVRDEPHFEMHFSQPPDKPLALAIVEENSNRRIVGDSFWHLYLAEPELVRRHLIPYLELLRANWQLDAAGRTIEDGLVQQAQNAPRLDTPKWRRLVDELGASEFPRRESAQRELLEIGQVTLPFLEAIDPARLDAEQAARVRTLIESLSVDYEDSSDRVTPWLAADRRIWFALLQRREEVKRRVAAAQLERLTGQPLEFDPAADDAIREAQLEKLRPRFEDAPQATGEKPRGG
jgi:hypothetical protein